MFTQVDIITCREEISEKKSQIEMLKGLVEINKQLVTEVSKLKVTKKGKSVALQTDVVSIIQTFSYVAIVARSSN